MLYGSTEHHGTSRRCGRALRSWSIVVIFMALLGHSAAAWAAPSGGSAEDEVKPCDLEDASLKVGRELYARANRLFQAKDYLGAIRAWELLPLLMPGKVSELRVQLAHAHSRAFSDDHDPRHLVKARELLRTHLMVFNSSDPTRAEVVTALQSVEEQLEALRKAELARTEREDYELVEQALAKHTADQHRRQRKIYWGVGGSLLGVGVGSLTAMSVLLANPIPPVMLEGELGVWLIPPASITRARSVLATGIIGGLATAVGTGLLATALHRRRITANISLRPTLGGLVVRF